MSKQAEDEKTSALTWNAVAQALRNHIRFHAEWSMDTLDYELTEGHLKAQRQALNQGVKALIAFVSPSDD